MITHEIQQGSPEWLELRAKYLTASEAPIMLGVSKHTTRAKFIRERATGYVEEITAAKQAIFDKGHQAEALARPIVEDRVGQELFPVTGTTEVDGLNLLASFDGLTMDETLAWENKLWNEDLAKAISNGDIDAHYWAQLEQQLLVSGADRVYFTTSDGTPEKTVGFWYESRPERRQALLAGWKQYLIDLAEYQHVEALPVVTGKAPDQLPALRIEVTGMVTASNLAEFKAHALAVFEGINTDLITDEDFANAERTVKWCKEVEDKLDAAKQHALSQTATIDELFRAIDAIKEESRQKRLTLDKTVKTRKESVRVSLIAESQALLVKHYESIANRLGGAWLTVPQGIFAECIKGKKTITGCQDALHTALANAKIAANELADRVDANRKLLKVDNQDWWFLFQHDFAKVCHYETEVFSGLLHQRIADEEKRVESEKLRAEQAKLAQAAVRHEEAKIVEAITPEPVKASVVSAKLRAQIVTELESLNEMQLMKVVETIAVIRSGLDKKAA